MGEFPPRQRISMKINIRKEMDKQLKKEQKAFDKRKKKLNEHSFSFSLFKWRF
jgi:hypothetical protein